MQWVEFQERAVKFERESSDFSFLVAADGGLLSFDDLGKLVLSNDGDDRAVWVYSDLGFKHVTSGREISVKQKEGSYFIEYPSLTVSVDILRGPEKLPSEYLSSLKRDGWVCLTSILPSYVVDRLQHIAATDAYEHLDRRTDLPAVCQDAAVGKTICEPVSLWLIREYLNTRDLHLAHPPNCIALAPYDKENRVQGWHSDIPYGRIDGVDRKGPIKAVQRNVCISDFKKENGATAYKLGSHAEDLGPPEEWNPAHGGENPLARPYSGPEASVIEAPAGSIVLYDARTWHRAGFNLSGHKRGAMLMSFQTADVIPKKDTRPTCSKLHASPVYQDLNLREQQEITELMMNQPN